MKKQITLFDAVKVHDVMERNTTLIYRLPTEMSWSLQQVMDILGQMKRLWRETVTARIPSELIQSVDTSDMDTTLLMMDDISAMTLPIFLPDTDIKGKAEEVLDPEETKLLDPLWGLLDQNMPAS